MRESPSHVDVLDARDDVLAPAGRDLTVGEEVGKEEEEGGTGSRREDKMEEEHRKGGEGDSRDRGRGSGRG
eukprot:755841-Hanusia_phi.AAC.2